MTHVGRQIYKKKLKAALALSDDAAFLQLVWALDALRSERPALAERFLNFSTDPAASSDQSRPAIHVWELESLCSLLFTTPKAPRDGAAYRLLNCREFRSAIHLVRLLRQLENAESGIYLGKGSIWSDVSRLGHRQFPWQRGYLNQAHFFRYGFIFGDPDCDEFIKTRYGISVHDMSLVGFILYSQFMGRPWLKNAFSFPELSLTQELVDKVLGLISVSHRDTCAESAALLARCSASPQTAYMPSLLRQRPVVAFGEQLDQLIAPLPELIIARITSGIYYDLVVGPSRLRNAASARFEEYVRRYTQAVMPSYQISDAPRYKFKGNDIAGPDALIKFEETIVLAFECKATKLSYAAQFAADPSTDAKEAFEELAKGIFQLWRFFSHVRRGLVPAATLDDKAVGVVVTLDYWLQLDLDVRELLFSGAQKLADKDPEILPIDRKYVAFCPIGELESIFAFADEDDFREILSRAAAPTYEGWSLVSVAQEIVKDRKDRAYPFELSEVLPWWDAVQNLKTSRLHDR